MHFAYKMQKHPDKPKNRQIVFAPFYIDFNLLKLHMMQTIPSFSAQFCCLTFNQNAEICITLIRLPYSFLFVVSL